MFQAEELDPLLLCMKTGEQHDILPNPLPPLLGNSDSGVPSHLYGFNQTGTGGWDRFLPTTTWILQLPPATISIIVLPATLSSTPDITHYTLCLQTEWVIFVGLGRLRWRWKQVQF